MATETSNNHQASDTNGSSSGAAKVKRTRRRALPNAVQSNTTRSEITIKGKISSAPKAVTEPTFPLNRAFLLSIESDELFIKTSKNKIVSLSSGDVYSANVSGYLVIL